MPHRWIYIPRRVLDELSKYGFKPSDYEIIVSNEPKETYLRFYSPQGSIGAVLIRYGVPRDKIGLCVTIVEENGGYVEDIYSKSNPDNMINKPKENPSQITEQIPQQLTLPGIFK